MWAERNLLFCWVSLNPGICRGSLMASSVNDIKFIFMDQNTLVHHGPWLLILL